MDVVCIFPVINNETNIPSILEECNQEICGKLIRLGATNIAIKFPALDYTFVANSTSLKGPPKGQVIQDALKSVAAPPDFVIVCDGSGKIPYAKIIDIFRELVSDSSINCVMAHRVGGKAITNIRYLIERWEVFSLEKQFGTSKEILDGQCGLWGYRAKKISFPDGSSTKINLTANGYDIELDLLSEVLKKNIDFTFIPVELPIQPIATNFTFEDNIRKMTFVLGKHPELKSRLLEYLAEFNKKEAESISNFEENETSVWKNYCKKIEQIVESA